MPQFKYIQSNFNGGELTPKMFGRTDLARYFTSLGTIRNYIPTIFGNAERRPGLRYYVPAMGPSRLIPFQFSILQSYQLEFGNKRLRFLTPAGQILDGGIPYEIATPYDTSTDDLWDIKFVQQNDVMYLVHPNHPVMRLNRLGETNWTLTQPAFHPPPMDRFNTDISGGTISLTLGALTGDGVTFTASAPVFIDGDVGKAVIIGEGRAYITAVGGSTSVDGTTGATLHSTITVDISDPFDDTSVAAGSWFLFGSPNSYFSLGHVNGTPAWVSSSKLGVGGVQEAHTYEDFPTFAETPPSTTDSFRAADVGRYVSAGGAIFKILEVVNSAKVNVQLFSTVTETFAAPAGAIRALPISGGAWSIQDPAFDSTKGYPRSCAFFGSRLYLAGSSARATTVYGSVVGDYENFSKGSLDDASVQFTEDSGQFDVTLWMSPFQGQLVTGNLAGEWAIGSGQGVGGNGSAVTPSNVSTMVQSLYGSSRIQPLLVESQMLYVQRSLKRLFEFSFSIYSSVFSSKELTLYSAELNDSGFKELVYQQNPNRIIWVVCNDGELLGLTYKRDDDVWGWHRHDTGFICEDGTKTPDKIVSVGVMPSLSALTDELWCVTERFDCSKVGTFKGFTTSGPVTTTPAVPVAGTPQYNFNATGGAGFGSVPTLPLTVTVNIPTASVGDTLVAYICVQGYAQGVGAHLNPLDALAGWNLNSSVDEGNAEGWNTILTRVVDGTEGPTVTFQYSGPAFNFGGFTISAWIIPISGVDHATPLDVVHIDGHIALGNCYILGTTTTVPNTLLLMGAIGAANRVTPANIVGTTTLINAKSSVSLPIGNTMGLWSKSFIGPGPTGIFNSLTGWNNFVSTWMIAIQPGLPTIGDIEGFNLADNGAIVPSPIISGSGTELTSPRGAMFDSSARLWVADSDVNTGGGIFRYDTPLNDGHNTPPDNLISGGLTNLAQPYDVDTDSAGKIYVANFNGPNIPIYAAAASGNIANIDAISGGTTGLTHPRSVAVNRANGDVYVVDDGVAAISCWVGGNTGNVAPDRVITGAATLIQNPKQVRISPDGHLWVLCHDGSNGFLLKFNLTDNGNVAPQFKILSSALLGDCFGLAIDTVGNIFVSNLSLVTVNRYDYGTGSMIGTSIAGGIQADPNATITGWQNGPWGLATDPFLIIREGVYQIEKMEVGLNTDAATKTDLGAVFSSVSGLGYLAGKTVAIKGDGAYLGDTVVPVTGIITLPTPSQVVEVGLKYTSRMESLYAEMKGGMNSQGYLKRFSKLWVRLLASQNIVINGQRVNFRTPNDLMGVAVPDQTIDLDIMNLGGDRKTTWVIEQDQPFNSDVLAVFGDLIVGEN